jgi:hypothetical protein
VLMSRTPNFSLNNDNNPANYCEIFYILGNLAHVYFVVGCYVLALSLGRSGEIMEIAKILDDIKNLPQLMRMAAGESIAEKTFTHEFSPPADPNSAAKILEFFGVEDKAFLEFYSYSNGVRLFHNETENDDTGKYFLPHLPLTLHCTAVALSLT